MWFNEKMLAISSGMLTDMTQLQREHFYKILETKIYYVSNLNHDTGLPVLVGLVIIHIFSRILYMVLNIPIFR